MTPPGENFPKINQTPIYAPDYSSYRNRPYMQRCTIIWAIVIVALAIAILSIVSCNPKAARAEIAPLAIARQEIGHGEQGANNRGKYVRQYLNGREGLPWCAGFISYCFKRAGKDIPYTLRAKNFIGYGRCLAIAELRPGDLVVFSRKGGGHVGIVERIDDYGFISIEGNLGKFPAKVKRVKHLWFEDSIYRFVRI